MEAAQYFHAYSPPHCAERDIRHVPNKGQDLRIVAFDKVTLNGVPIPLQASQHPIPSSSTSASTSGENLKDSDSSDDDDDSYIYSDKRTGCEEGGMRSMAVNVDEASLSTCTQEVERAGVTHLTHGQAMQGRPTAVCI